MAIRENGSYSTYVGCPQRGHPNFPWRCNMMALLRQRGIDSQKTCSVKTPSDENNAVPSVIGGGRRQISLCSAQGASTCKWHVSNVPAYRREKYWPRERRGSKNRNLEPWAQRRRAAGAYLKRYCPKLSRLIVHGSLLPRADILLLGNADRPCSRISCTEKLWHPAAVPSGAAVLDLAAASTTSRTSRMPPRINLATQLMHRTRRDLRRPVALILPTPWSRGREWAPPPPPSPHSKPLRPALPGRGLFRTRRRPSPGGRKGQRPGGRRGQAATSLTATHRRKHHGHRVYGSSRRRCPL